MRLTEIKVTSRLNRPRYRITPAIHKECHMNPYLPNLPLLGAILLPLPLQTAAPVSLLLLPCPLRDPLAVIQILQNRGNKNPS